MILKTDCSLVQTFQRKVRGRFAQEGFGRSTTVRMAHGAKFEAERFCELIRLRKAIAITVNKFLDDAFTSLGTRKSQIDDPATSQPHLIQAMTNREGNVFGQIDHS